MNSVTIATDAYLKLIPSAQEAAAVAYTRGGHLIIVVGAIATILASALIIRVGLPERALGSRSEGRQSFSAVFRCCLLTLLAYTVLLLPWTAFVDWYRERSYGFTHQSLPGWLTEHMLQAAISSLVGAALLTGFYLMARRSGRRWWIWGSAIAGLGLLLALVAIPIVMNPILHEYSSAPDGKIKKAVDDLLAEGGVRGDRVFVYDGSRQSERYTASVTGFGSAATVALSDTMFARGADAAQVRAVVAHEIGHQRHYHLVLLAFVMTAIVTLGLLVADKAFPFASRILGAGSGVNVSDAAGLPVLLAIFACYMLVTTPAVNTAERLVEADADHYGLDLAKEPDGAARAVLASADYRASSPGPLEEELFYDHPSNARRIRTAMRWKVDHTADRRNRPPTTP